MIAKLLIANRGEIACRIIRTARAMGIRTVAVYSDADAQALHVRSADEAVRIGPAPVVESYLRGERIVEAAKATGADAIHPGYGFLSENPDFVEAVEAAGLIFVGPSAAAIRAMGLKDAAKRLMAEAGVPVVPGYHGSNQDPAFLAAQAGKIGYPVLIKARAGGGGKGMRRVDDPAEFASALEGAQREAQAAFGDGACLIETYVSAPRHIEIQVFGDSHGNAVHLFERDCSLQRRHQKVIEEAPAPGMTTDMRAAMGAAAVKAAQAIGYSGAGTIEFIVDASDGLRPDRFWFMEMNTRLQVEHPVTEAITGLDLVALQLRVAMGEPLPFRQDELSIDGHAFEARIYAEDASRGFLPAVGRLDHLAMPAHARVDTGIVAGDTITPFYDPMIAKLIVHGPTRASALGKLSAALGETRIAGTVTNVAFLAKLAAHPGFAKGEVDTGLIDRDLASLLPSQETPAAAFALAALAASGAFDAPRDPDPWTSLRGFRAWGEARQSVVFEIAGEARPVAIVAKGTRSFDFETPAGPTTIEILEAGTGTARVAQDGRQRRIGWSTGASETTVFLDGEAHGFARYRPGRAAAAGGTGDRIVSPMPGTVRSVTALAGARVAAGAPLVVVEAMKMEHTLKSPRDGVIAEALVAVGDQVQDGMLLVALEPLE